MYPRLPPLTQAYVDGLPHGLDSYPDAAQKATVVQSLLEAWPAVRELSLPPALRSLVDHPPPANVWVPEAQGIAMWLLAADVACGGDLERFKDFARDVNRRVLSNPLYGFVMRLLGPRLTARAVNATWSAFHRGIEQSAVLDGRMGTITLRFPSQLLPAYSVASFATALEASLEVAGVEGAVAHVVRHTDTEAVYTIRW